MHATAMLSVSTSPLFSETGNALGPVFTVGLAGGAAAMVVLIGFCIAMFIHDTKATVAFSDRPKRVRIPIVVAVAAVVVAGLVVLVVGTTVGMQQAGDAAAANRAKTSSWLHDEYGATVNPDNLVADSDHAVVEIPATIDGRTQLIKLAPTPDGHIAAFQSDDVPLTTVNR